MVRARISGFWRSSAVNHPGRRVGKPSRCFCSCISSKVPLSATFMLDCGAADGRCLRRVFSLALGVAQCFLGEYERCWASSHQWLTHRIESHGRARVFLECFGSGRHRELLHAYHCSVAALLCRTLVYYFGAPRYDFSRREHESRVGLEQCLFSASLRRGRGIDEWRNVRRAAANYHLHAHGFWVWQSVKLVQRARYGISSCSLK